MSHKNEPTNKTVPRAVESWFEVDRGICPSPGTRLSSRRLQLNRLFSSVIEEPLPKILIELLQDIDHRDKLESRKI